MVCYLCLVGCTFRCVLLRTLAQPLQSFKANNSGRRIYLPFSTCQLRCLCVRIYMYIYIMNIKIRQPYTYTQRHHICLS